MPLDYTLIDLLRAGLVGAFIMWVFIVVFYSLGPRPPKPPKDPPPPGPLGYEG